MRAALLRWRRAPGTIGKIVGSLVRHAEYTSKWPLQIGLMCCEKAIFFLQRFATGWVSVVTVQKSEWRKPTFCGTTLRAAALHRFA